MTENETRDLLAKYKLSQEEHDRIYETIKRVWTFAKYPTNDKIAVIIGGQTGAGKSGIISYSMKMFEDGNVVVINSDEIKPFHPKAEEIARLYPELYTQITDQESNTWTSRLFEELRQEGYNIIFEGTMKNNRVADESITQLRDELGYTVVVRGLCVCDLESRMSILERYEEQVLRKGWGRMVVPAHHNQTYVGMPNTIEYIENTGKYDVLEIFQRGESPDEPVLIYSVYNPDTLEKTAATLENVPNIATKTQRFGYASGKESIEQGREEDYSRILLGYPERLKNIKQLLTVRKQELTQKITQATTDIEKNNLEYMLSQLEEEAKQVLELLNTWESKKKVTSRLEQDGANVATACKCELDSAPTSNSAPEEQGEDDDAR